MIINELKLTNFCIDRGEHEFNLAPTVVRGKSKPVVLFGGMNGGGNELYLALLKQRCKNDGLDVSFETLNRQLRLHLHRGIGYMAVHGFIKRVDDLVRLTKEA